MQPTDHIFGSTDLEGHNSVRAETVDISNIHQDDQMRDGYRRTAYERRERERRAQEMIHTIESALGIGNSITISAHTIDHTFIPNNVYLLHY
jgi:hypothetical protein